MTEALITILISYFFLTVIQVIFWPISKSIFGKLPDEGWSVTRMLGILLISISVWNAGHLGLAVNTKTGVTAVALFFLLISLGVLKKKGLDFLRIKRESFRFVVLGEYLFVAIFFISAFVRGYLPNLDSLEKFMDYGFMVSYLSSPSLPAADMWQAGSSINYYSFGHFWASVLVRLTGQSAAIGYNLVLGFIAGTVAALTFVVSVSIGALGKKVTLLGGMMAALVMIFGSNSHTLWYLIKNGSLKDYWYADATRFIEYTIHEFPAYSLVVSDLHGHLLDLPVVILFLITLFLFNKHFAKRYSLALGGLMGIMMMTNTWDVPIYGMVLSIYFGSKLVTGGMKMSSLVLHGLVILGSMVLIALPWWLGFEAISDGIAFVTTRSPLWQLAALWTLGAAINLIALKLFYKTEMGIMVWSLGLAALLLIVIPELVYAKDIYPDHPRANTMFKLTYQSTVLTAVLFGAVMTKIFSDKNKSHPLPRLILGGIMFFIFGSLMIFPTLAYPAFYSNFKNYQGLDGEAWLKEVSEPSFEVVQYLKQKETKKNMVEAVGDSYTLKNVISAYTGVPTIQGWRVHQWLWRGGYDVVAVREAEVREIYESDSQERTEELIKKYNLGFIVVGLNETEQYSVNHRKLMDLGEVKNFGDGSYLVEIFTK